MALQKQLNLLNTIKKLVELKNNRINKKAYIKRIKLLCNELKTSIKNNGNFLTYISEYNKVKKYDTYTI